MPPFYGKPITSDGNGDKEQEDTQYRILLASCYFSSIQEIMIYYQNNTIIIDDEGKNDNNNNNTDTIRIASPLLGTGCRGYPTNVAIQVAAVGCNKLDDGYNKYEYEGYERIINIIVIVDDDNKDNK